MVKGWLKGSDVHAHALGDQPADGDGVRPSARIEAHARGVGSEFWSGQRLACDARTSASTKCRLEADLGVAAT